MAQYTSYWNLANYPAAVFPTGLSVDPRLTTNRMRRRTQTRRGSSRLSMPKSLSDVSVAHALSCKTSAEPGRLLFPCS